MRGRAPSSDHRNERLSNTGPAIAPTIVEWAPRSVLVIFRGAGRSARGTARKSRTLLDGTIHQRLRTTDPGRRAGAGAPGRRDHHVHQRVPRPVLRTRIASRSRLLTLSTKDEPRTPKLPPSATRRTQENPSRTLPGIARAFLNAIFQFGGYPRPPDWCPSSSPPSPAAGPSTRTAESVRG